jgi:hypothetical protein
MITNDSTLKTRPTVERSGASRPSRLVTAS